MAAGGKGAPVTFVLTLLLVAAVAAQGTPYSPFDVSSITVSAPKAICELDLNMLKGDMRRLSWSPDGRSLHVQTLEGGTRLHDYIVLVDDGMVSAAFGEPEWSGPYWARKSDLAAPGKPSLKLEVTSYTRRTQPAPFSGGFTNGGNQTPDPKHPVDAFESEVTLRLVGEEVGHWVNDAPLPGETFGWGPTGSAALTFVDKAGRLMLIDQDKHRHTVAGIKGAWMPAWSSDGTRLAFLVKSGRRTFRLMSAAVHVPGSAG